MNYPSIILTLFTLVAPIYSNAATVIEHRLPVGPFASRAIFSTIDDSHQHATVILLPGSGAQGPEEQMAAASTLDNQDHSIFAAFSAALNAGGVNTLALGKPGVEYFTSWDPSLRFYDKNLYKNLVWEDLIKNARAAIDYVLTLPETDPSRIYILGHSEGTSVAVDVAALDPRVKGVVLLGYLGTSMASLLDWQFYRRDIEFLIATDIDSNQDRAVDRAEAALWPDFVWNWQPGQLAVSFGEIETALRADVNRKAMYDRTANSPLYSNGIFTRDDMFTKTAQLTQDVFAINGELDMQTPAREVRELEAKCLAVNKKNCTVTTVQGVGHCFSAPRPPRQQPLADMTMGPVSPDFQSTLTELAVKIATP